MSAMKAVIAKLINWMSEGPDEDVAPLKRGVAVLPSEGLVVVPVA